MELLQDVPQLSREVLKSTGVRVLDPLDLQSLKAAASSCTAEQLKHSSVEVSKFLSEGDAELVCCPTLPSAPPPHIA